MRLIFIEGSASLPGVLEDWWSGIGHGYALRKLHSSYAGQCIRIRRSSDDAESDIGFNESTGKVDTSAITAFIGGGSGYVTTWYDQSGNGNNFVQATSASQPQILVAPTVGGNGYHAYILFDGSNDSLLQASATGVTPAAYTLFANPYFTDNPTNTVASGSGVTYPLWHHVASEGLYSQIIGQSGAARVRRQYAKYSTSGGDHRYAQVFNTAASGYDRVRNYRTSGEQVQTFQDTAGSVATSMSSFQWSLGAQPGGGQPAAFHDSHFVTYTAEQSAGDINTILGLLVAT
jgi:hypothetical protein